MTHTGPWRGRRSIRLRGYDYSQPGDYFVTLCTQDRATRFGAIVAEAVCLNDVGALVDGYWQRLPTKFPTVLLGPHVVMPNHLHALVTLGPPAVVGADTWVRPYTRHDGERLGSPAPSDRDMLPVPPDPGPALGAIVQWFKTMSTNAYIRRVRRGVWPPFRKHLWQRNYWEHIIRNEADLAEIVGYIDLNPAEWAWDRENREAMRCLLRRLRM